MSGAILAAVEDPCCNTGVTQEAAFDFIRDFSGGYVVRFDYYRASVGFANAETENRLFSILKAGFGVSAEKCSPLYGYSHGFKFVDSRDCRTTMVSVFLKQGERPLVQASGVFAHELWLMLREPFAGHLRLTRGDVCLDAVGVTAFERLDGIIHGLALQRNVKSEVMGDWDTPGSPSGRTRYIGSRLSPVFRRLYEHLKCHGYGADARFELEAKPLSQFKAQFGDMSPDEILRSDDFSRRALAQCGVDLTRLVVRRGERPDVRPLAALARQYGAMVQRLLKDVYCGSAEDFIAALVTEWERQRSEANESKR